MAIALGTELHVWRARLDSTGWPDAGELPAAERRRAAEMLRPAARRRWIAARWALRGVLADYLERAPGEVALRFGNRGKPMLADTRVSLRFNLSHSGGLALIAVADDREIGVDVQRLGARPAEFYSAWTRREATAKCHGTGLLAPLPVTPVAVSELDAGRDFAAAVAIAGTELPRLRQFDARPGQRGC